MDIEPITRFAQMKGLSLVGTGDFTHPKWFLELKEKLVEIDDTGLYAPRFNLNSPIRFMVTTEVSTIFQFEERVKKIHHVILVPNLEVAEQVNDRLAKWGDLAIDGRPTLTVDAPSLVEEIVEVSRDNEVFPSHAWTPWFSIFGAFSGFDRVEDCYQDMTKHIHALETGLSSNPPMNWRLSSLDRFILVSNSDGHSAWPWRLGREANVFELSEFSYREVIGAIREKDPNRFKFTIETDPAYGKYHWTGHRVCGISLSPQEAIQLGNKCPACGRRLTKGVEQRVEELADRPSDYKPDGAIPFMHLLPLHEIIATTLEIDRLSSSRIWEIYNAMIGKFGNEYAVLIEASREDISKLVGPDIADLIVKVREGRVRIDPGYDGVYGKLVIEKQKPKKEMRLGPQRGLNEFI